MESIMRNPRNFVCLKALVSTLEYICIIFLINTELKLHYEKTYKVHESKLKKLGLTSLKFFYPDSYAKSFELFIKRPRNISSFFYDCN